MHGDAITPVRLCGACGKPEEGNNHEETNRHALGHTPHYSNAYRKYESARKPDDRTGRTGLYSNSPHPDHTSITSLHIQVWATEEEGCDPQKAQSVKLRMRQTTIPPGGQMYLSYVERTEGNTGGRGTKKAMSEKTTLGTHMNINRPTVYQRPARRRILTQR